MIPDSDMAEPQTLPLFAAAGAAVPKTQAPARQPSYIRDHRKRLRQRFLQGGAVALPDYELLELVLFRAIPRQDVKTSRRQTLGPATA
jgi:DNA repair protein RadC